MRRENDKIQEEVEEEKRKGIAKKIEEGIKKKSRREIIKLWRRRREIEMKRETCK